MGGCVGLLHRENSMSRRANEIGVTCKGTVLGQRIVGKVADRISQPFSGITAPTNSQSVAIIVLIFFILAHVFFIAVTPREIKVYNGLGKTF